uniref:Protein Red n=1 Tax=Caenorhabditis japonica TaxID=281687 RepID=A0A8R1DN02_CAEJA
MANSSTNLRNEDFRKLLTTARSDRSAVAALTKSAEPKSDEKPASFKHKHLKPAKFKKPQAPGHAKGKKEKTEAEEDEAHLKNILKNYRDRASERRKQGDEKEDPTKLTAAYRAVPGDARTFRDQADLRKQAILESKYLGGDLEHTHLVKGLDYSLLNKVRSEMNREDEDDDDDIETAFDDKDQKPSEAASLAQELAQSHSENRMVRSLHRILFKNEVAMRNELFAKGRMAYVVELEDEETDIPTTLLRSLHDCPRAESAQSIQASSLIISKLSQVISHLRQEPKKKKREDTFRTETTASAPKGDSIYDDLDDYVPSRSRHSRDTRDRDRRDRDRRDRSRSRERYFEKSRRREEEARRDERREKERAEREKQREREKEKEREKAKEKEKEREKKRKEMEQSTGYDECYPGGLVEMGGAWDSDEEADFTKMDAGPKKNQAVNRWDFDTEEEYASYMEGREALPKAAYQYGMKNGEGRQKNKKQSAVSEAKKLDRELNEINKIMEKRKTGDAAGGGEYKKPKY